MRKQLPADLSAALSRLDDGRRERAEAKLSEHLGKLGALAKSGAQVKTATCVSAAPASWTITARLPAVDKDGAQTTSDLTSVTVVADRLPVVGQAVVLLDAGRGRIWCLGPARAAQEAWSTYTPTILGSVSNGTLSNGTLSGRYWRSGPTVTFSISYVIGSADTLFSGALGFSLPAAPLNDGVARAIGHGNISAASGSLTSRWPVTGLIPASGTALSRLIYNANTVQSGGQPLTFAAGDAIRVTGAYETA